MELPFTLDEIQRLPQSEQRAILKMLEEYEDKSSLQSAREGFMGFTKRMWPEFISGRHHREIADLFDAICANKKRRVMIHLPPRHPVWVGHRVTMADGTFKTVGEVEVGDRIITHRSRPRLVRQVFEQGSLPTLRITTKGGRELYAHHSHPFLTPDGMIEAGRLTPEMVLGAAKFHDTEIIPIKPEAARLAGYLVGDGSVSQKSVGITMDETEHMQVEDVRRCCDALGFRLTKRAQKFAWGICRGETDAIAWAKEWNILGHNAYTKHIPDQVLRAGPEAWREFLSGYFTADGIVVRRKGKLNNRPRDDSSLGFCSVSKRLMEEVQALLARLGIASSFKTHRVKMETKKQPGGIYTSHRLSIVDWHNSTLLLQAIDVPHSKRQHATRVFKQKFDGEPYIADKIQAIEEVEPREHRCFDIEDDDTFTIEDIVVSNTKSEFASWLLPAFYLGRFPKHKIIQVMNTADLATNFGRKVRDTMETPEYQEVFPGVTIKADSRSAGRWNTSHRGGEYYATGTGGAVAGRGANLLIIDDATSEAEAQAALFDPKAYDSVFEWYGLARQRLQPNGKIVIVCTRWSKRDLPGQIVEKAIENGTIEEWDIINYPAILPSGNPLWPEYWSKEELLGTKKEIPPHRWNSQYQQAPTNNEEAIIKSTDWKPWSKDRLPVFSYILQSWDTAFTAKTTGDYSACTTWGIFFNPNQDGKQAPQVMLINSYRERLEFPELKRQALQQMRDYAPDLTVIERRGSGISLIQELQQAGIYVEEFTPGRSADGPNDKVARANAVSDVWRSGNVWYNTDCPLNETTIEECADLPKGDHDDLADTATQAIKTLRDRMLIGTQYDTNQLYEEDDEPSRRYRGRIY